MLYLHKIPAVFRATRKLMSTSAGLLLPLNLEARQRRIWRLVCQETMRHRRRHNSGLAQCMCCLDRRAECPSTIASFAALAISEKPFQQLISAAAVFQI